MFAVYRQVLGDSWQDLDEAIRRFHSGSDVINAMGAFQIRRGENPIIRALASLLRLPRSGDRVEMQLAITRQPAEEKWRRSFAGKPLVSTQWAMSNGLLGERFRTFEVWFRLTTWQGALHYQLVGAALRVGGVRIPLHRWLRPDISARETPIGDPHRLYTKVEVRLPLLGRMISYEGEVACVEGAAC